MTAQQKTQAIWDEFKCEVSKVYLWQDGPLSVWLKRLNNDWLVASKLDPESETAMSWSYLDDEPEALDWKRWVMDKGHPTIQTTPVMPDRPLVVKTRIPSNLPQGVKTSFYVSIPVGVKLSVLSGSDTVELTRINTVTLSSTWFGDHLEGLLCYALKTKAVRDLAESIALPHRAICQVNIQNDSEISIPIQKICIRAKHLDIYMANGRLWTNKINVTFRGEGLNSRVDYKNTTPEEAKDPVLLQKAEEAPPSDFLRTISHNLMEAF